VKYHKENFKKIKEAMKKFNIPDSSGSNKTGEGEMIASLKERFYSRKRELKYYNFYGSSNKLVSYENPRKLQHIWFRLIRK
jgi:hypothetical protein